MILFTIYNGTLQCRQSFITNTGGGDTKDDIENTLSLIMALPVVLQKISCLQLLPSLLETFDK